MTSYLSIKGGCEPVSFETAILDGFACDGGLYVPNRLPVISVEVLNSWKDLSYRELAFEIASLFIDSSIISHKDLKGVVDKAYVDFEKNEVVHLHRLKSRPQTYVLELFHGPTLSFKDIGMAFLVNLFNLFLSRKKEHLSVIVATTGDTGPAAAHFISKTSTMDAWVLYPREGITLQQERQMSTLYNPNIHAVSVSGCPNGGDDLDEVIRNLYADKQFKEEVRLSSVNSINWGRVMIQMVHYFYGYLKVVDSVGEPVNMVIPSGGFGNLCAGSLARLIGLPVKYFGIANNRNACLHRIFTKGEFALAPLQHTVSSAIDILTPFNFWRYLYFIIGQDASKIKEWSDEFDAHGKVSFGMEAFERYSAGYVSTTVSDDRTLNTIKNVYQSERYLLDPHGAVAVAGSEDLKERLGEEKLICMATAHPSKFPKVIQSALGTEVLPEQARHGSIEQAKDMCSRTYSSDYPGFEKALRHVMRQRCEHVNRV